MSTKGQVVLPQAVRTRLGLVAGSELEVTIEGDAVILRRVSRFPAVTVEQALGSVAYDGPIRLFVADDEVQAARAARVVQDRRPRARLSS